MTSVQAILFDKDGTLFDFQQSWTSWAVAMILRLSQGDRARAESVADVLGFDLTRKLFLPDSFAVSSTPDEQMERLGPVLPEMCRDDMLAHMMPRDDEGIPVPVRGLTTSLEAFQSKGLKLGVVTNDFEATAIAHLRHAGVSAAFDVAIGFDSGYGAKPAPEGCLAALLALGVLPEHSVMVGDSLHDIKAGWAAGLRTVGVLTGTASRADLAPWADFVVQDVSELAAFLA
jgi:phosphoglycolate phosphatase